MLISAPATAQSVTGTILDGASGRPIPSGVITLLTEPGEVVIRVEADSAGVFSLTAPRSGSYYLRAERIGYRAVTEGIFDLGDGGTLEVEIHLVPQPVEVEGVDVQGERTDWIKVRETRMLEAQGFFDRQKRGFGYFITPEDIEERPPFRPRDLFRMIPGMETGNVTGTPGTDGLVRMGCAAGSRSEFAAYVNGIKVFQGKVWDSRSDIAMGDITAVEVYHRIATLPIEYSSLGVCGVILIWTK